MSSVNLAIDDSFGTPWQSGGSTMMQWFQLDLGRTEIISRVVLVGKAFIQNSADDDVK